MSTSLQSKDEKSNPSNANSNSFESSMKRLLSLAYPDRSSFASAVGALCVSSACNLLLPTVLGLAVDRVSGSSNGSSSSGGNLSIMNTIRGMKDTHFFLGCLGIFGLGSIASWYRTYTVGSITENIAMRLRCQIYASVLRQDLSQQLMDKRILRVEF